jgi:CysZ protein
MDDAAPTGAAPRPGFLRRAAAGAWEVPAGFVFLLRNPRLWLLAALPALLAVLLTGTFAFLGLLLVPQVDAALAPTPGSLPEWVALPISLLLGVATVAAGAFLGFGLALALAAPLLDELSRRVEARARGEAEDASRGLRAEIVDSLKGALYFLAAAPVVLLLGLVPLVGPLLSLMLGARAVALQMTDSALSRRGLRLADKRRWHRDWRVETSGFGLVGLVGLIVPFANLLLGPALVTGGTLLVLELEDAAGSRARPLAAGVPGRPEAGASGENASGTATVTG